MMMMMMTMMIETQSVDINHGQMVSVQWDGFGLLGWLVGMGKRVLFGFSSFFGIIKPIYDDIPLPSAFQKSISRVF